MEVDIVQQSRGEETADLQQKPHDEDAQRGRLATTDAGGSSRT